MPTPRQKREKLVREKLSFNIYKPQMQGVSFSNRGVVHRELGFQVPELTKAS